MHIPIGRIVKDKARFILSTLGISLVIFMVVACGTRKQGYDQYASQPTSLACLNGVGNCDNSSYNQYSQYGFQAYPGNPTIAGNQNGLPNQGYSPNGALVGSQNGYPNPHMVTNNMSLYGNFCSCPSGTRPVYNGQIGLGCVSMLVIQNFITDVYYYGAGTNATSTWGSVNWNQISNMNGGSGVNGCYSNLAWACFVGNPNPCFQGQFCQSVHPNSRLGICRKSGSIGPQVPQ